MVVLAAELARRYGDQGIVSIAMNPGNVATPLQREIKGFQRSIAVSIPSLLAISIEHHVFTELDASPCSSQRDYNTPMGWNSPRVSGI
jgi:NAD(P)-dependent dehydrogenase (short-subunit alcohol dehydrogenase family)